MTQKRASGNKRWLWLGILGVMIMVLVAACGTAPAAQDVAVKEPLPNEISVEQGYKLYEEGTFLLDVRTPEEWDDYHIEGTTLIPLDELESRVDELPKDEEIVVVCRSGNRSQVGRDILRQAGISQSTSMAGGVKAWYAAGYPTVGSP
jgi:rhodanese-related sulfurtransferase